MKRPLDFFFKLLRLFFILKQVKKKQQFQLLNKLIYDKTQALFNGHVIHSPNLASSWMAQILNAEIEFIQLAKLIINIIFPFSHFP